VRFWKDADKDLDPRGDFPEHFRADSTLGHRLQTTEAEAVLADMVEHTVKFYRGDGTLRTHWDVKRSVTDYRKEQEHIG